MDDDAVWVGPSDMLDATTMQRSNICIAYSTTSYEDTGPLAVTYLQMRGKQVQLVSRISTALNLLAFAYDAPTNLLGLTAFDPDVLPLEACNTFGIRYEDFFTPKVGQYLPGTYLAAKGSVWRYYLVEDYGEIVPLADCELAAPLVARAWIDREIQRTDLSTRLAKFIPPNAPELLAQ